MFLFALGVCALAQRQAGKVPQTLRFNRVAEPKEHAFTILVPQGWRAEGGILRVDPSRAGGPANSIEAKLDFAIKRDAAGSAMIRWLPDVSFIDMRGSPAARMGAFPPGSNYNGMTVRPAMNAAAFLEQVAFPYAHPQVRGPQVLERKPVPGLLRDLQQAGQWIPVARNFSYDAALLTVTYQEGGVAYKEKLVTGIVNMGQIAAGMWGNKQAFLVRAPAAEFDALTPVFTIIQHSTQLDHKWLAGEIRGQLTRSGIADATAKQIQEIDRQIVASRQKTNWEINNDMYLTLTGQEEFVNPYTKEVERGSNEWKYRWVTPSGEEAYSNQDSFDPNHDPNSRRSDFKRSQVRPR